jgi:phage major head subunit gpT-like protein
MNKFGEKPPQYTQMFNVLTSQKQYEDDSYVTGFGPLVTKNEGQASTYDDAIQGYDKRYTHVTRSLAYRISREMIEDDRYRAIQKMPMALARSTRTSIEQDAANIYNNGFTDSAAYHGGDSKPLFSASHPLRGGGAQTNLITGADLSSTSLESACVAMRAQTDDRGNLLNVMPKKLVVAPSEEWTAKELLQSTNYPLISANTSAINVAKSLGLELVVNDYLTDADAWFLLGDDHEINWFWRVTPDHYQDSDFDTDDAKFKVRARWSNGWSLPWGIVGSAGAG